MRVNIYQEELTNEVDIITTVAETGITYYGVRVYLKSPPSLHYTEDDDDRSAVTFWLGDYHECETLQQAIIASMPLSKSKAVIKNQTIQIPKKENN